MVKDEIFKIKKVDDKPVIKEDKRKTISPFNSAKHLKTANIPALCDQCVYRSIDEGGNGKCPKYEKGAACAIRDDFVKFIEDLDTRNPEDLKAMMDMLAKLSFENVLMALTQSKMDGNIPDRNTKSEVNTLLGIVKSIIMSVFLKALSELNSGLIPLNFLFTNLFSVRATNLKFLFFFEDLISC